MRVLRQGICPEVFARHSPQDPHGRARVQVRILRKGVQGEDVPPATQKGSHRSVMLTD